jgi:hypothetical protein
MSSVVAPNPSEHGWPFATGPGQVVTQAHWKSMARTWQANGVQGRPELAAAPSPGNTGLFATKAAPTQVEILPGVASINGYYFELASPKPLDIDITGTGFANDGTGRMIRSDLVVLKLDEALAGFRFVQIKGGVSNSTGQWRVNLNDPETEIPLFQVNVEDQVGIAAIVDRRWFLGKHVRSLAMEQPGFEPAPVNGDLAVDLTGSRLVIGKDGQWISAREVFKNDLPPEIGTRLDGHDSRLAAIDGSVSALQTSVTGINGALTSRGTTHSLTVTAESTAAWNMSATDGGGMPTSAYIFERTLYVTISMKRLGTDFAPMAWGAFPLFVVRMQLPAGARFRHLQLAPALVTNPTVATSGVGTTAWFEAQTVNGQPGFVLAACPSGVKANGYIYANISMPLTGSWT